MQKDSIKIHESIQLFKQSLQSVYSDSEIQSLLPYMAEYVFMTSYFKITLNKEKTITSDEYNRLNHLMAELKAGKPIQYIMGYTYFLDLHLNVNEHVLIPRPETEELAMEFIQRHKNKLDRLNVLDVGTGSGCIAIAIKKNLPWMEVDAVDVSSTAIAVAKKNASINQVDIAFYEEDFLQPSEKFRKKNYDFIISNPPYILNSEKPKMIKQVIDYEPQLALFVPDTSPLLFYEQIATVGKKILKKGAEVLLEMNEFHHQEIRDIFLEHGYTNVIIKNDLQQKPRILSAQYNG